MNKTLSSSRPLCPPPLLHQIFIKSMEQGPWEAKVSRLVRYSQILGNSEVRYSCHKRPPLVLILSEMNSTFATPFCYFNPLNAELNPICHLALLGAHHILQIGRIRVKIRLNVIFLSTPRTSRPFNSYRFLLYAFLFFPELITCPAHVVILDLVTLIGQSNPVITTSIYSTPRLCRQIISGAISFLTVNHNFILVGNNNPRLKRHKIFFHFYDVMTDFYCICLGEHNANFLIVSLSPLSYHFLPFRPTYPLQHPHS
jgi:hypothetical protein